jgi:hypothetical protein
VPSDETAFLSEMSSLHVIYSNERPGQRTMSKCTAQVGIRNKNSINNNGEPVAQSLQCLITDWTTGVRSPTEAEDLSSNLCVRTGSGAHPASCTVGTGGKGGPGRDTDHSPPSSIKVRTSWSYTCSPP